MNYNIRWNEEAVEDLKKLDKPKAKSILQKVESHLTKEPLSLGKPLKGIFKGLYRYRCENYRIIYAIDRGEKEIIILRVGDRKETYRNQTG